MHSLALKLIAFTLLSFPGSSVAHEFDCWKTPTEEEIVRDLIGFAVRCGAIAGLIVLGLTLAFTETRGVFRAVICVLYVLLLVVAGVSIGVDLFGCSSGALF